MNTLMKFDPQTGLANPYPSEVNQYRDYHGQVAWLYNPYTGQHRDTRDIGTDVHGLLIAEPVTLVVGVLIEEEPKAMAVETKELFELTSNSQLANQVASGDLAALREYRDRLHLLWEINELSKKLLGKADNDGDTAKRTLENTSNYLAEWKP